MKIVVFGNSGSGKTTLSSKLGSEHRLIHLDLDTIAWDKESPAVRESFEKSEAAIQDFCRRHRRWVVEGCYADLLEVASEGATHMVFLNPGIDVCRENCRNRPWEPKKYASKQDQDKNLKMLLDWVEAYDKRNDEYSLSAHQQLFEGFRGHKVEVKSNIDASQLIHILM
jgi:adenylate kinase family enzyme